MNTTQPLPFWQISTVEQQVAKKKSWIYQEIHAGRFPRPLKIGKSSVWDSGDVERWKDSIRSGKPWLATDTHAAA